MTYFDIIEIAEFILLFLFSYLLIVYIIPWFKNNSDSKKMSLLKEYVIFAVRFAEQVLGTDSLKNSEKKKFVLNYILRKTEELGLVQLTEQDINIMVESIVNLIKHSGK